MIRRFSLSTESARESTGPRKMSRVYGGMVYDMSTLEASRLPDMAYLEVLDQDPRPTLILDLEATRSAKEDTFRPAFCNLALKNWTGLYHGLLKSPTRSSLPGASHEEYQAWVRTFLETKYVADPSCLSSRFFGVNWTSFTLKDRWRIISANGPDLTNMTQGLDLTPPTNKESTRNRRHEPVASSQAQTQTEDIDPRATLAPPTATATATATASTARIIGTTAFAEYVRQHDWSATKLGPIRTWPHQLVDTCNLMLACPDPAVIYWGEDHTIIYNEACIPVFANHDAKLMGTLAKDSAPELFDHYFAPIFREVLTTGKAVVRQDSPVPVKRDDFTEQVFFTTTFLPLAESEDRTTGILELWFDSTKHVVGRRRTQTLLKVNASLNSTTSLQNIFDSVVAGVEDNPHDVPQMLVYLATNEPSDSAAVADPENFVLKTSIGYDTSKNISATTSFKLATDTTKLASMFRQASTHGQPLLVAKRDNIAPEEMWEAFEPRGSGDAPTKLIICPVPRGIFKKEYAFLLIGLSARQHFDYSYSDFIDLLHRQISTSVASTLMVEQELGEGRSRTERFRHELVLRTAEAEAHEGRFTSLAAHAPVGICIYNPDGSMAYANELWYNMTQFSRTGDTSGATWWSCLIFEEDLLMTQTMFERLMLEHKPVSFEVRLKATPYATSKAESKMGSWVVCSAYAEQGRQGVDSIVACFTDISKQKRAEETQRQRMYDAIEAKRHQENFIDITCHEIRNPLSVVLQCGAEIIASCGEALEDPATAGSMSPMSRTVIRDLIDAAETIEYCTLHQKRIIDDILTLSKMDSGLLPVTPDRAQPLLLTDGIVKIFERELRVADIQLQFELDSSFRDFNLEWIELDPGRFSQMLINLISNAIKFTRGKPTRKIDVRMSATTCDVDTDPTCKVNYLPRQAKEKDRTQEWAWPADETVFLHCAVQDTGDGMTLEEQKTLFQRFSQATPRTHVQYGGSGLGLYICRALSEMHGGQIGFTSEAGAGSTFGFYIKVRRMKARSADTPTPDDSVRQSSQRPSTVCTQSGAMVLDPLPTLRRLDSNSNAALAKVTNEKFNVMVVEDNLINQKVLSRQLEKLGHTILLANHGLEALETLERTHFWIDSGADALALTVILLDIEMPVMDGLTCAKKIRELERRGVIKGHVPIIAITGNARDEKIQLVREAGIDEVVLKPFTVPKLIPLILRLKQQHQGS